jgi:circadian clock protein KaiC
VTKERIPTGVKDLDENAGGQGLLSRLHSTRFRTAGSGKSSLAAHFADQTCRDGRSVIYVAFENHPRNMVRNMRSIGIDLEPHVKEGLLILEAWRPTQSGLEMHLLRIHKLVESHKPAAVVHRSPSPFDWWKSARNLCHVDAPQLIS